MKYSYVQPTAFDLAVNRIVPIPKQVEKLEGEGLKLTRNSKFSVTAPTAEFGPVKTAGERVRELLAKRCGKDCLCTCDEAVKVTLSIADAPFEMSCSDEGYCLSVADKEIAITGYGERGLLYGVITLEQLCKGDVSGCEVPAIKVVDWPDCPMRGISEECRVGSDMMRRDEWLAMLDDLAARKMNVLGIKLHGCWLTQYDGRLPQYVYLPIKGRPELKTPKIVKYWSVEENRWVECEKLPPIFEENFLEDIFRHARDLGIQVMPGWNSFGHNNLLPALYPETAPVDENGVRQTQGFCTSSQATYDLLFSIFDQIIDDYMIPYGMENFSLVLDEVHAMHGMNANDPQSVEDPWCKCPECRKLDKGDIFIRHAIKLMTYLKSKGIKTIEMACDMLQPNRQRGLGLENMSQRLMDAAEKAGVKDNLLLDWWSYHEHPDKNLIKTMHPELGLRGIVAPWNGYHHWAVSLQALNNVRILGEVNKENGGEGIVAYAMWDRCADRNHDAIVEYSWNIDAAGSANEVTRRYALRHFGPRAHEAFRAFRMMDWCTEERYTSKFSIPEADHISNWDLLSYHLTAYTSMSVKKDKPFPAVYFDDKLKFLLTMRNDMERSLYSLSAMGKDAKEIFFSLAMDSRCDRDAALRLAYECENYQVMAEDWLAIFEMYDLALAGAQKDIAPIARTRQQARLDLMARCEKVKERCIAEAGALRLHSIFMQFFADVAQYVEGKNLNMEDLSGVLSERSWWLR